MGISKSARTTGGILATTGEADSRSFHKFASMGKKNNQVTRLKDKDGIWREDATSIQEVILDYFSDLFKTLTEARGLTDRETVHLVTEEQNVNLIRPVSSEDVKATVFSMYPEKSSGPDRLNPAFFQTYWSTVGTDVIKCCQEFFNTGELLLGVNRTVVCLISKVKQPQQMTDLRPIFFCNVLFRILSKVMANRLKPCLHTLISDK